MLSTELSYSVCYEILGKDRLTHRSPVTSKGISGDKCKILRVGETAWSVKCLRACVRTHSTHIKIVMRNGSYSPSTEEAERWLLETCRPASLALSSSVQ